jgi:ABC-type sugar transport system substrate-binding protein
MVQAGVRSRVEACHAKAAAVCAIARDGNVVAIQGLAGISVTTDRSKSFKDELEAKCPGGGVRIVASQPGDFNPDTGLKLMKNIPQAQNRRRLHARRRRGSGRRVGDSQRRP